MLTVGFLGLVLAGLMIAASVKGGGSLVAEGLRSSARLFMSVIPQLVLGFALAGLVSVILPSEALARTLGDGSGLRGLMIATAAGMATPGGPFVQFPLVAAISRAGVGPGPVAAYLTAWSLMGWHRIVLYELPLLGATFTVARLAASAILPLIVGLAVPAIMRLLGP